MKIKLLCALLPFPKKRAGGGGEENSFNYHLTLNKMHTRLGMERVFSKRVMILIFIYIYNQTTWVKQIYGHKHVIYWHTSNIFNNSTATSLKSCRAEKCFRAACTVSRPPAVLIRRNSSGDCDPKLQRAQHP